MRKCFCLLIGILFALLLPCQALASGANTGEALSDRELEALRTSYTNESLGEAIALSALSYVGAPYSQELRGTGRYMDCSYLVQKSYMDQDVGIPGTAAAQAGYCVENGYLVEKEDLMPGDVVFWRKTGCSCGRAHEIHHAAIYLGEGKVVEASSSKGLVVTGKLWETEQWKIEFCARPYIQDIPADCVTVTGEMRLEE